MATSWPHQTKNLARSRAYDCLNACDECRSGTCHKAAMREQLEALLKHSGCKAMCMECTRLATAREALLQPFKK